KRGIVRVFISNTGDVPLDLSVYFSITGWFSDLNKLEKLKYIDTLRVHPSEVFVRDIVFKSSVKQGKNYFQLIISKKKARVPKEYVSSHIEYSQIREILEDVQIERSNYLGMLSRAYVDPRSLNYWVYYSIFGHNVYRKDGLILLLLKILGILAGGIFITLSFLLSNIFAQEYILPVSSIVIIISLLSLLTNADRKKIKLINELGLSDQKKKINLATINKTTAEGLQRFCVNDINFGYNRETNVISWKPGANKLFEKLITTISDILSIPTGLEPLAEVPVVAPTPVAETVSIQEDEQVFGIELDHEEGIDFEEGVVEAVSEDAQAVKMEIDGVQIEIEVVDSESSITPEVDSIITEPDLKQQVEPIVTDSTIEQSVEKIESKTAVEPKIQPIETKTEGMLSDTRGMVSPGKQIDVDTIPAPKKLPVKPKKDSSKGSVKDLSKEEK
ncbi:MAG: hypothetical protein H7641_15060, partial [Candidatus Heimdallarchaeota archaeon]|nr:hypothetical protein [Candidatus Heimdallarchaeota archaeon]MCK4878883.1 hypothetical protein [Candidatus Heimdallarchaeota archaeon]